MTELTANPIDLSNSFHEIIDGNNLRESYSKIFPFFESQSPDRLNSIQKRIEFI